MSICQLGMHKNVQDHTNANVCKQTYDASCTVIPYDDGCYTKSKLRRFPKFESGKYLLALQQTKARSPSQSSVSTAV